MVKVYVYKLENGRRDVLVEPTLGNGKAPVLLKEVTSEDILDRVLPVIVEARRPSALYQERSL